MVSAIDYARRSLVALLKALAKTYGVVLALTRDCVMAAQLWARWLTR
jgi:hypothetical protein